MYGHVEEWVGAEEAQALYDDDVWEDLFRFGYGIPATKRTKGEFAIE
jgi:hypothetical protein